MLNVGPRRSQPGQRREPRKIITVSVKEDVHLKKAENAWKPSQKRDSQADDPENIKTQVRTKAYPDIVLKLCWFCSNLFCFANVCRDNQFKTFYNVFLLKELF